MGPPHKAPRTGVGGVKGGGGAGKKRVAAGARKTGQKTGQKNQKKNRGH